MRRVWDGLVLLTAALLGLFGCASREAYLKPPKPPEEYKVPPSDDPRFSQPPSYPKGTLNEDVLQKRGAPSSPNGLGMPGSPGSPGGSMTGPTGRMSPTGTGR